MADPIQAAKAALHELVQTAVRWREVRRIARVLPRKYRGRIPDADAGLARVKGIFRSLRARGAIQLRPGGGFDGYGAIPIALIAVVAGVALVAGAAALVVAMIPRIQQESRTSKRALQVANVQANLYRQESASAAVVGPTAAREMASARAAEAAALFQLPTLAAEMEEGGIRKGLPAWLLPVGIIGGAAVVAFLFLRAR